MYFFFCLCVTLAQSEISLSISILSNCNFIVTGPVTATTFFQNTTNHYSDVIMSAVASQITTISIVCSTVGSGADRRKHQRSALLAFVWGIHRWPVNSPHKMPVTQKMFPFDAVTMVGILLKIPMNLLYQPVIVSPSHFKKDLYLSFRLH